MPQLGHDSGSGRLHQPVASTRKDPRSASNSSRQRTDTGTDAPPPSAAMLQQHRSSAVPRPLRLSDRQLVKSARLAASSIDWDALRDASATWSTKKKTGPVIGGGGFSVASRQEGDVHHIMATGSVACSVAEMQHVLWTTTPARYLSAMAELHGSSFLSGSVVHTLDSLAPPPPPSTSSGAAAPAVIDVTVKTATFAKAHLFARDEHWCFVDYLQPESDRSKFAITMHSLRPEDVLLPPLANSAVTSSTSEVAPSSKNQLHEMTAGYAVATDPRGGFVWLTFYARFLDINSTGITRRASKSTTKARLMKMATATCGLPAVVQRRRLGAQVFANPKAFTQPPNNTHCKCCTVALTLFVPKKRCYLCGYRACAKCVSTQEIERGTDRRSSSSTSSSGSSSSYETVQVCTKCTRRVNAASYDDLHMGVASPPAIKPDPKGAPPVGKSLVEYLRRSFENTTDAPRKRALVQVVKSLLASEGEVSASARSRSGTTQSRATSIESSSSGSVHDDYECIASLEENLHVRPFALEDCAVAHPDARTYPIDYRDDEPGASSDAEASDDAVTHYPIPETEQTRIDFVAKQQFTGMTDVPELEIICSIASQEMNCAAGLVTIIADDKIHIIASNDAGYQNLVVPRAESICSHMVMSDKPLLLPHPAADIRFNKMPPVSQAGVRFYCGFPLISPDNAVYGSVCCVDNKSHDVTQSQYAVMSKLATTAARIMELRAPKA